MVPRARPWHSIAVVSPCPSRGSARDSSCSHDKDRSCTPREEAAASPRQSRTAVFPPGAPGPVTNDLAATGGMQQALFRPWGVIAYGPYRDTVHNSTDIPPGQARIDSSCAGGLRTCLDGPVLPNRAVPCAVSRRAVVPSRSHGRGGVSSMLGAPGLPEGPANLQGTSA